MMDLPYSKISMVIMQMKYVKNSTNYFRKKLLPSEIECNFNYYFQLEHWHLQTISQT